MPQNNCILVTGGAGFIGSNYIKYVLEEGLGQVINLDKLTYAGDLRNLDFAAANPDYHFVQGDICDTALVKGLFEQYDIKQVVHFAAESHVDNSIENPDAFVQTNIVGTHRLLQDGCAILPLHPIRHTCSLSPPSGALGCSRSFGFPSTAAGRRFA